MDTGSVLFSHEFARSAGHVLQSFVLGTEFAVLTDEKCLFILQLSSEKGCDSVKVFRNVECFGPISEFFDWGFVQNDGLLNIVKENAKIALHPGIKRAFFAETKAFLISNDSLSTVDWQQK